MKNFIFAALFVSTSSFAIQTDHVICIHNSNTINPHYQSWITHFPSDDTDSLVNAIEACEADGGLTYFGFNDS